MNLLSLLFYPIVVIFTFFGNLLFKHSVPGGENSRFYSHLRRLIQSENIELSPPLSVTRFIKRGEYSEARKKSTVSPDIGGIQTFSGFFDVNEDCSDHLFFWFVPAESNWENAPLILWLNGGPGGSSLFGLFNEVGPWNFKNGELIKNQFSWNRVANILFIDQPVGTGFSFSDKGCFAKGRQDVTEDLYSVVIQFLKMFPELQTNKFFLAGMSFAGHYIPETAALIIQKNEIEESKVNLVGIVVGSPFIQETCNYKGDLLYELGIADEHDRDYLKELNEQMVQQIESKDIKEAIDTDYQVQQKLEDIGLPNFFNILEDKSEPYTYEYSAFVSSSRVKEQIHVGSSSHQYSVINTDVFSHYQNAYYGDSSAPAIKYLLEKNYNVVFFYGQLDMITSYSYFECVFKGMGWEGSSGYLSATNRPWYVYNHLAGWYKVFNNLLTLVIRNSGHNIPQDQGEVLFELINSVLISSPGSFPKDFVTVR